MHFVYILKSTIDQSKYVGYTTDLKKRVEEHNNGKSTYSSSKRPYMLVWFCGFSDKKCALDFEKYLKHGSGHAFAKKHLVS